MPGDSWIAVRVESSADPQHVIDELFACGSQGVQQDGAAIITHFPPDADIAAIEEKIRDADASATISISAAPQLDWSEWRANVREHRLGRVTIAPPWLAGEQGDSIVISIDPAMAFGTGEHATTRGVIRLMQRLEMPDVVADLGSGSAVLSIVAAKLGAERVAAIELDHDAIGNAQENVDTNGVSDRVTIIEGDAATLLPLVSPVGLVLANIISSVLLELLSVIRDSLNDDGRAILSGILVTERDMMIDAISRAGFEIVDDDVEEGWWSVLLARPR